jgi:hypothetical protein
VTGAPVPPARIPEPAAGLLDSIALVEAISADDVEGVAAILRHADLAACSRVLDSLMARELLHYSPMAEALGVLVTLGQELKHDPSPGGTVLTLARQLGGRWCDDCIASRDFRQWALERHHAS